MPITPGHHRADGDADPDPEIDAMRGGQPLDEIGQPQRHARKPRQMVGLRAADAGHRHVAVADGLDLLHAMRRGQPVELGDDLVEQGHGARRAEPLGKLGEADQIAEQDGGLGDAVGDALARPLLQPLGDRLGQDVGEQRIGLGPRAVGHREGVADDQRDDAEGGDGGGDVEIGEQRGIGGDQGALRRKQEPRREMQREADRDHRDRQPEAGHAADGEGDRGGDDVVDLNAGVVAELAHEKEQRDELGDGDQERGGDVVDAVGERHEQRDRDQQQIDDDQRQIMPMP